ncbi:hypothetical protein ACTA71_012437 [Dictyostelium dimigraforme]
MPSDIKITFKNKDGESTISGKAITLPTPRIFPPPYFIGFRQYQSEGKVWENEDFEIESGTIEYDGEEYDIGFSKGSWHKNEHEIDIRIMPREPPKKFLPFFH